VNWKVSESPSSSIESVMVHTMLSDPSSGIQVMLTDGVPGRRLPMVVVASSAVPVPYPSQGVAVHRTTSVCS